MSPVGGPSPTSQPPTSLYDVMIVDLDGVVYWGSTPVPHATTTLRQTAERGTRVLFATNNSSRTPAEVAAHLGRVGLAVSPHHVVTSAQAAAQMAATLVPEGSAVLVVGGQAMVQALAEQDLIPVRSLNDHPRVVVQGLAPEVDWRQLAEAAYGVAAGLPWVVSNMDLAVPRDRGLAPGNGALAEVVRMVTGRTPLVAGKPEPGLYAEALSRGGAGRVLAIGDRLDTDIAGARRIGLDNMLVLTGVTSVTDLLRAAPEQRPTFIARDLRDLTKTHPAVCKVGHRWRCRNWTAETRGEELVLEPSATSADLDAIRALCAAAWEASDLGRYVRYTPALALGLSAAPDH